MRIGNWKDTEHIKLSPHGHSCADFYDLIQPEMISKKELKIIISSMLIDTYRNHLKNMILKIGHFGCYLTLSEILIENTTFLLNRDESWEVKDNNNKIIRSGILMNNENGCGVSKKSLLCFSNAKDECIYELNMAKKHNTTKLKKNELEFRLYSCIRRFKLFTKDKGVCHQITSEVIVEILNFQPIILNDLRLKEIVDIENLEKNLKRRKNAYHFEKKSNSKKQISITLPNRIYRYSEYKQLLKLTKKD